MKAPTRDAPSSASGFWEVSSSGLGLWFARKRLFCLLAVGLVLLGKWWRPADWQKLVRAVALMAAGLLLPLVPWAARNWNALHDVQFLAPHYSTLPGEFAPLGFDAWINTWLWRFRDVYLVTWKLDVEEISVDDLPCSASILPSRRPASPRSLKNTTTP